MSALNYIRYAVIPACTIVLPEMKWQPEAIVELIAIGLQETKFIHRAQVKGPAESFWQFESGGGWKGVTVNKASRIHALNVLQRLSYGEPDLNDFYAMENNDILACCFARLLLYTDPRPLPVNNAEEGWQYYLRNWKPGKPHPETWDAYYQQAQQLA